MKIDFSTIFLVILCVIPGLFAQRSRNSICPRSFEDQGATAELGELVALGISTHGLLACLTAAVLFATGLFLHCQPTYFFHKLDSWSMSGWCSVHPTEAILLGTLYVFISFAFSHWLGLVYGVWRQRSPITTALLAKATWLQRRGVTGLLGERPIIYEALNPQIDSAGNPYLVFLELQLKDSGGFYSGQLSEFAIVRDEEPHKPIFLINVWFKKSASDAYAEVMADGVMIDLPDAITLQVRQSARGVNS